MLPISITPGNGPERYIVRVVFELAPNVSFPKMDSDDTSKTSTLILGGRQVSISPRDHYYVLTSGEIDSEVDAREFVDTCVAGLLLLAIRFDFGLVVDRIPSELTLGENGFTLGRCSSSSDVNWRPLNDGSFAEGGVWPNRTAIIPQHKQIFEYPTLWAKAGQRLDGKDIQHTFDHVSNAVFPVSTRTNETVLLASEVYAAGCGQLDRRIAFLEFFIVIELLARTSPEGKKGKKRIAVESLARAVLRSSDASEVIPAQFSSDNIEPTLSRIFKTRNSIAHELTVPVELSVETAHGFAETLADLRYLARKAVLSQFR